jgi:protein disulfide-isomerase
MRGLLRWMVAVVVVPWTVVESAAVVRNDANQKGDLDLDLGLGVMMPPHLNEDEFWKVTSDQLTLVEFFSPYCHHCQELYPKWEQAYKEFYPEMEKMGISMRQVDCVESGDFCEKQDVYFYPNIRLYGPANGKTKFLGSFPRMLDRNPESFKSFLREAYSEFNNGGHDLPSASELLDSEKLKKLVSGDIDQGWFVTFFPATNVQWLETDKSNKNRFNPQCYDCHDIKVLWDKLSNQVQSTFKTGHVNCFDNKEICEKLGYEELTRSKSAEPQFSYFLPKSVGQIRLKYPADIDLKSMRAHSHRLFENYQYERVTSAGILDLLEYKPGLFHKPLDYEFPLKNKIAIIYFFDIEDDNPKDREILPKILKLINDSPFNLHLYTAKHAKIDADIKLQAENMIKFINYRVDSNYEFDLSHYLAQTLTSKPTLLVMKDNTLITNVYQTFSKEDINDLSKVEKFINDNQYPLYQELTPKYLPQYFTRKDEKNNDKVVITFIDSKDENSTKEALYNISLAAHEYNHIKKKYYFDEDPKQKPFKDDRAAKLKEMNHESVNVIKQLHDTMPQFYNNKDVLFTYLDLSSIHQFKNIKNWKIKLNSYLAGDSIVVSRDFKKIWHRNVSGGKLKNDPQELNQILSTFFTGVEHVNGKFISSPYGGMFSFMNRIHQFGIMGYFALILMLFMVQLIIRKRSKKQKSSAQRGIIGTLPKKD